MNDLIQCQCGATLRRPQVSGVSAVRCPRCKAILDARDPAAVAAAAAQQPEPYAVAARPMPAPMPTPLAPPLPLPPRPAPADAPPAQAAAGAILGTLCPICQTAFTAGESVAACPSCGQHHHQDCWGEMGGCAVYGCKSAPTVAKPAGTSEPLSAWGDVKQCPVCGEKIKSIAIACRYCGTEFGTLDPLAPADLHRRHETEQSMRTSRQWTIFVFAASLIGVLAPIMAIVAILRMVYDKKTITATGPVYLVLAYSSAGLSVIYSLLMLIFLIAQ